MATNSAPHAAARKEQISRYRIWGFAYLVTLIISSPLIPWVRAFVAETILPAIRTFHETYLSIFPFAEKDDVELHFILQVLLCNLILIAFSAVETFVRGGQKTRFDVAVAFVLGFVALFNILMFMFSVTTFEFLYFTLTFAVLWVLLDWAGAVHARRTEPEMASTFHFSLAFVDGPTLAVCLMIMLPQWISSIDYPRSFTDGAGAGILLFSGMAWTSLMVFFVAPRAGFKDAAAADSLAPVAQA